MKYAVELDPGAVICIPEFIQNFPALKIGRQTMESIEIA
jgi:hypothetical protein